MKLNRNWFVGIGAYRSSLVLLNTSLKEGESYNEFINRRSKELHDLGCLLSTGLDTIGIYHGDKGIYIEQSIIFKESQVTLETLKSVYTKEECFYSAEIVSMDLVCLEEELYSYILKVAKELPKEDGMTLRVIDGYIYKINTICGELFS